MAAAKKKVDTFGDAVADLKAALTEVDPDQLWGLTASYGEPDESFARVYLPWCQARRVTDLLRLGLAAEQAR